MNEEIKKLLKTTDDYYYIFDLLFEKNQNPEFVINILNTIINNYFEELIDYELFYNDLLTYFDDEQFIENYIKSNLLNILNHLNVTNLINYKTDSNDIKELINKLINNDKEKSLKQLITLNLFRDLRIKYNEYDLKLILLIISELLTYEHKEVSDIIINNGSVSKALIIGDKVFKIGRRQTFILKDDKRYLRPILRRNFNIGSEKICLEVTERVGEDVNDNDLDFIVEEFKKKGKDWRDPSIDNIGRLIKPNKTYYKYPIYENTGYIKNAESSIVLPQGEIVIIDNDHTYDKIYTKK